MKPLARVIVLAIERLPLEVDMSGELVRNDFDFSEVLQLLRFGHRCARRGWNGKEMFIYLVNASQFEVNRMPLLEYFERGTLVKYRAHIDMKYADGTCGVWLASHSDMLEPDWFVLEEPI